MLCVCAYMYICGKCIVFFVPWVSAIFHCSLRRTTCQHVIVRKKKKKKKKKNVIDAAKLFLKKKKNFNFKNIYIRCSSSLRFLIGNHWARPVLRKGFSSCSYPGERRGECFLQRNAAGSRRWSIRVLCSFIYLFFTPTSNSEKKKKKNCTHSVL